MHFQFVYFWGNVQPLSTNFGWDEWDEHKELLEPKISNFIVIGAQMSMVCDTININNVVKLGIQTIPVRTKRFDMLQLPCLNVYFNNKLPF